MSRAGGRLWGTGKWGLHVLRRELQVHRLARQARPRVRGAQHHQGPQAQVTLTPVVTDGVHRVLQLEVPGLRLLSMTSGDNTAGQRPACPSMLAQRPWTRRAVPSPTALLGLCLLAQRQDTCPVPCLQPAPPPDLQDTRARPCWPGPMLWGALLGVSLQTTGRFSSWESGRWGVRFRAFSV